VDSFGRQRRRAAGGRGAGAAARASEQGLWRRPSPGAPPSLGAASGRPAPVARPWIGGCGQRRGRGATGRGRPGARPRGDAGAEPGEPRREARTAACRGRGRRPRGRLRASESETARGRRAVPCPGGLSVCPNFFLDGLLSWAKVEYLLPKILGHD